MIVKKAISFLSELGKTVLSNGITSVNVLLIK